MRILNSLAVALSVFTLTSISFASSTGTYKIDPAHSKVGFEVSHLVISTVEGTFTDYSGNIDFNEKQFAKSSVNANINVQSIDTGNQKRDDHLRSKDFFEVAKYPTMTFKSLAIKGSKEKFKMIGDLTIKGIKKRVEFEGKFLGTVKDGFGNLKAAFQAETKVSRKDFGLTWNSMVEAGPVVGDEVKIILKIQGARPLSQKQVSN